MAGKVVRGQRKVNDVAGGEGAGRSVCFRKLAVVVGGLWPVGLGEVRGQGKGNACCVFEGS